MRYVAVGDSFTEGVGDEQPDGSVRGWADLLAQGIANAMGEPIGYANLAIRGRLLARIATEQVDAALALDPLPTHISINGGGNDMLRPTISLEHLTELIERAVIRCVDAGVQVILLAGPDPGALAGLPLGARFNRRGTELTLAVAELADRHGASFVDNFNDHEVRKPGYWATDRLHLNAAGHAHVAANMLRGLGYPVTTPLLPPLDVPPRTTASEVMYYREHVFPWMWRHLQGRSSGDGRSGKYAQWVRIAPAQIAGQP